MPRATSDTDVTPVRAPRRRVARPRAKKVVPDKAPVVVREKETTVRRKAPTKIRENIASPRRFTPKVYVPLLIGVVTFMIAIVIGYSDKGEIDLAALTAQHNADVAAGSATTKDGDESSPAPVIIPVQQNTDTRLNGGLQATTVETPPDVVVPPIEEASTSEATTTASSSAETVAAPETTASGEEVPPEALETESETNAEANSESTE